MSEETCRGPELGKGTLSTEDLQAVMTNGNGTLKDIGITYVGDITVLDVISRMEK